MRTKNSTVIIVGIQKGKLMSKTLTQLLILLLNKLCTCLSVMVLNYLKPLHLRMYTTAHHYYNNKEIFPHAYIAIIAS